MKLINFVLICVATMTCQASLAQTRCPGGVQAGSVLCQPDQPDQSSSTSGRTIVRTVGRWEKTWGAIADGSNGIGGVTTGKKTKEAAEEMALTACVELGGVNCQVSMSYRNQCAVIAQPVIVKAGHRDLVQVAESIEKASEIGLPIWAKNNNSACKIVYSDCAEPIYFDK